jgi:ABC-type phosphate transport system substrate-binding protein
MKHLIAIAGLALAVSAHAGIAVVGHPSAAPLNKDQVADIFIGKDLSAKPVDQAESAAIRADFYKKVTGREAAQVKAAWSRIAFSGKGQPPKDVGDAAGVKKAVAADPKAIGYIDSTAVDGSVKVLLTLD